MKRIVLLLTVLGLSFCVKAQNQYSESLQPSSMESGVYYQSGPGGNNGTFNWTYPYGTKLSIISNNSSHRNFELMATIYPYGNLALRQFDPSNNVWTNWRNILVENRDGNVGIGTTNTKGFRLGVNGKIAAEEVKVALYGNWSDFVFYEDYKLPTLLEVEKHIKENGHLKDIPSAAAVAKNGIFLGEMDAKLLQKIEELTLYTIEQQKEIERLKQIEKRLEKLEKMLLKKE